MSFVKLIETDTGRKLKSEIEKFVEKGYLPRYESFRIIKNKRNRYTFYMFMDKISDTSISEVFRVKNKEHSERQLRKR